MKTTISLIGLIFLFSCHKNVKVQELTQDPTPTATAETIEISEISSNAYLYNEFGNKADWVELKNSSNEAVLLKAGDWTLSDKEEKPNKFEIPEITLQPHDFILIWCDKSDDGGSDIHANFKISADEAISLFYKGHLVDQVKIDSNSTHFQSFVRNFNTNQWETTNNATPDRPNRF